MIADILALYYWPAGQWVRGPATSLDTSCRSLTALADKIAW